MEQKISQEIVDNISRICATDNKDLINLTSLSVELLLKIESAIKQAEDRAYDKAAKTVKNIISRGHLSQMIIDDILKLKSQSKEVSNG